ncbi:MAG: hypothetical protein WC485_10720, partial [Opitutaceae bacterium]
MPNFASDILLTVIVTLFLAVFIDLLRGHRKRGMAWLAVLMIAVLPLTGATRYTSRLVKAVQAIVNTLTVETSATIAAATVTGNQTIGGTLGVTGVSTLTGGAALQNGETITNATDNTVKVNFGGATAALGVLKLASLSA